MGDALNAQGMLLLVSVHLDMLFPCNSSLSFTQPCFDSTDKNSDVSLNPALKNWRSSQVIFPSCTRLKRPSELSTQGQRGWWYAWRVAHLFQRVVPCSVSMIMPVPKSHQHQWEVKLSNILPLTSCHCNSRIPLPCFWFKDTTQYLQHSYIEYIQGV